MKMVKERRVRINEEDYIFFKSIAGRTKNQREMFNKLRPIVEKGDRLDKVVEQLDGINNALFGELIWPRQKKRK